MVGGRWFAQAGFAAIAQLAVFESAKRSLVRSRRRPPASGEAAAITNRKAQE
jgi:hypothetical protein